MRIVRGVLPHRDTAATKDDHLPNRKGHLDRARTGYQGSGQTGNLSGACACGGITWRSAVSPFRSVLCHCEACRATAGAGPVGYMGFGKVSVSWTGQRVFRVPATGVTRGACADCGTPLSYMCTRWPGELYVHAATLTDPALFRPEAHVHWAERRPGILAMDDLPEYDGPGPSDLPSQLRP